jgi:predicted enzyme related to lactoylglutathione lyase
LEVGEGRIILRSEACCVFGRRAKFRGLRTVTYHVGDLDRAKEWYRAVLGIEPYFDEPFYAGFDVGGFELGLQPEEPGGSRASTDVIAYRGVDDVDAAFERLLEFGATEHGGVQDVGGDIRVATVIDPYGNVFGVIENPYFSLGSALWFRLATCPAPPRLLLRFTSGRIPSLETRGG